MIVLDVVGGAALLSFLFLPTGIIFSEAVNYNRVYDRRISPLLENRVSFYFLYFMSFFFVFFIIGMLFKIVTAA